jgi:putative hydrolase of the HAD superfamily
MTHRAWLIDVWETLLTSDFAAMTAELADIGRVPADKFRAAVVGYLQPITIGELSVADAFMNALETCGVKPTQELAAGISATHTRFLLTRVTVLDDAVSFITRSRRRGDLVALVSNCGDETRPLLAARGLIDMVDAVVLSCEVGAGKPDRSIFDHAINVLGIDPSWATLIDDQYLFCEGAVAAGLRAIHLVRNGEVPQIASSAIATVQSFDDIR